jgi:OOP family OmpA-OmpF porin
LEKNMNAKRASETLGLLAMAVIVSPLAVAADSGGYIGGNVGQSRAHFDEARIGTQVMAPGRVITSIASDDRDTGYKLFGGYQFNRNFAIEGGYFDLGKFGFSATTIPPGTLSGSMRVSGINLDLVGILPLTEKFSAFGRLGMNYAKTRDSFFGTGAAVVVNPNPSDRDLNHKFGLGLQYNFTESFGMRAEAERYRVSDAVGGKGNVNLFSVGLVYRFGGKTPEPVQRTVAPAPAPEPYVAPPPKAVVVTPPPPAPPAPYVAPPPPPPPQEKPQRIDRN